ncbi:MAG: D-alanyl-D-alanine carboxypeptidase [Alphaproteobacteria bacterium]|nr:D-alanyl-D-alanine carboxypeptidase [Alphaproteobacteria bacterium]
MKALGALGFLAALSMVAPASAQTAFESAAPNAVILDAQTGITLYCRECDAPVAPASMSKLMTMLIVAEELQSGRINENTEFVVSERVWRAHGAMSDNSHMFLAVNSRVRVGDLVRGAIIVSANDACVVLAEGIAGSEDAFVARMNRRARELGLRTARFRNVTGLDDPDQVISVRDLARLARHMIAAYPDLYRLYSQRDFTYNNRTQPNRNPLLGAFEGADGVKTGHTAASGYGLIGSAVRDGQRRIVAFRGMATMAARATEAERLLRAAFYDFQIQSLYPANAEVAQADVWLGGRATVPLVTRAPIAIGLGVGQREGLSARVVYQRPIPAPIAEGDELGRLVIEGPHFARREYPLYAGRRIGRANWFARAWAGLGDLFGGGQ